MSGGDPPIADRPRGAAPGPNRRVLRLALPIILSNVSVPLLGAVDTAVVGHLPGPQYLGAVAVGATIFSFVYWAFGFLRMGTTGFTAQAFGAGDGGEVRAVLARGLLIGLAVAILLIAIQIPIAWAAFTLIEASDTVEGLAQQYFAIRIWGAPATLANYAFLGWFFGVQNTRAALWHQLWMNGVNVALDLFLVVGLGMGVAGVAIATVLAEYSAVGVGFLLALRILRPMAGRLDRQSVLAAGPLRVMLAVNRDIMIRTVCLVFAFALFTARGARMGDVVLAANAVLLNFQTFMAFALDGFANAAEALVGGAIGARSRASFDEAIRISTRWAVIVAVAFCAAYGVAGWLIVELLTGVPEVRQVALDYLPWVAVLPAVSVWSFQLDGIFIGATRGPVLRNAMLISATLFVIAVAVLTPVWGNHGLWLALVLFMIARAVTLAVRLPALAASIDRAAA